MFDLLLVAEAYTTKRVRLEYLSNNLRDMKSFLSMLPYFKLVRTIQYTLNQFVRKASE